MNVRFAVVGTFNQPLMVALYFGLAGTFFFGIYLLRRVRQQKLAARQVEIDAAVCAAAFRTGATSE